MIILQGVQHFRVVHKFKLHYQPLRLVSKENLKQMMHKSIHLFFTGELLRQLHTARLDKIY